MRKLMWLTIGICGGVAGCLLMSQIKWLLLAAIPVAFVILFLFRKKPKIGIPLLLLIGFLVGFLYKYSFDSFVLSNLEAKNGNTVPLSIEATDYSYESKFGIGCDGVTEMDGREYCVRFYVNDWISLAPGDVVEGDFRLRVTSLEPTQTSHSGKGIYALCYPKGEIRIFDREKENLNYFPQHLKHRILTVLDSAFPEDTVGFAKSLLLGETNDLTYAEDTDLKVSGIRHVVAVSGLHISILCGFLAILCGKHKVLMPVVCLPVLAVFAAMIGFTPSVLRAAIMFFLILMAVLLNREYDPLTALSFAALCLVCHNPYVLTSVSFQLSFGCVAGIILFAKPIADWLKDNKRFGPCKGKSISASFRRLFVGSVSVSCSAMALTTPMVAYHFGTVSLIGPLTNLLVLWAVPLTFGGILLAAILGTIWLPLGTAVGWVVSWPVRYIQSAAHVLALLPVASVYTVSKWIAAWLIFAYILFILFMLVKKRNVYLTGCLTVIGLCAALLMSYLWPAHYGMSATVLDVGQGQSVLLQSEGKSYLVDCGGKREEEVADLVAETLLSQGITHLNGLVISHFDWDHVGGAEPLLSRIPADVIYLPEEGQSTLYERNNVEKVSENLVLSAGNMKMTLFPGLKGAGDNDSSISVLFQNGNCDILIISDRGILGEADLLRQMDFPEVEVLVVGHHGSKTSTCESLLQAVHPQWAVISAGKNNSYGHPAPSVLQRLEEYGCRIWRTDLDGTFTYAR